MPVGVAILGKHIRQSSKKSKALWKKHEKYHKAYKEANREKYLKYYEAYNKKRANKIRRLKYRKAIKRDCPWYGHFLAARRRCYDSKLKTNYLLKKTKFNISLEEIKKLWKRDNASKMKLPVLHRKDNNGHYEYSNCEFMPCGKHSTHHLTKNV